MAAKVVMVAVPAVLGIASIRVHPVGGMEGILSPEKLSIYRPLPRTNGLHFIAEQPGELQSSLSAIRGGLLPYIQTAQGALVSVKIGSVNTYHASRDIYHYLKDPPPGFLPRIGSIYMAGLVGMFITRNGSRLRRISVPVALMAAGASVCYPALSVALLKVTGMKLYGAGQWGGAKVSSLLTSTTPPPGTSPQAAKDSTPSSAQHKTAAEPEPSPPPGGALLDFNLAQAATLAAATPTQDTKDTPEIRGTSPDSALMDFGQSDPEDRDMYSTRS